MLTSRHRIKSVLINQTLPVLCTHQRDKQRITNCQWEPKFQSHPSVHPCSKHCNRYTASWSLLLVAMLSSSCPFVFIFLLSYIPSTFVSHFHFLLFHLNYFFFSLLLVLFFLFLNPIESIKYLPLIDTIVYVKISKLYTLPCILKVFNKHGWTLIKYIYACKSDTFIYSVILSNALGLTCWSGTKYNDSNVHILKNIQVLQHLIRQRESIQLLKMVEEEGKSNIYNILCRHDLVPNMVYYKFEVANV